MEKFKTKILPLNKIKANQENPRVISESRLQKLINSLLVFPRMLSLRPIVINDQSVVLGGNMRLTALSRIAQWSEDEVLAKLETLPEYNDLPDGGAAVREYWSVFLKKPQAEVVIADDLSEDEKKQFIIKDNVSFGDWDYDELENWDAAQLEDWGVDTQLPDFGSAENAGSNNNLPPELNGVDLMPDGLEKLQGDDKTAMQRVIICYKADETEAVANLLGITTEDLEKKVVYRLEELGI